MVDFVSHNLPDWNADADELDALEEHVYRKLCDAYYLLDGHLRDDDRHNARRCKIGTQKYRQIKKTLVNCGKIEWRDGFFWSQKTEKTLQNAFKISEKAREKANKRWKKNDTKSLKTNEQDDAGAYAPAYANSKTRKLDSSAPPVVPPAKSTKGTQIPDDWQPSEQDFTWASGKGFGREQVQAFAETFHNYWLGESGARATKRNWSAAFKVWVNRETPRKSDDRQNRSITADNVFEPGAAGMGPRTDRGARQQEEARALRDAFAQGARTSWGTG